VAAGDVDIAIGTDIGGSIRIPAAWCGCVGLKPTYGLVPYTRIAASDVPRDHAGPLAETVADCARVLDAVAGSDPDDPRQGRPELRDYTGAIGSESDDLSIGVVAEGFDRELSDTDVDAAVREALVAAETAIDTVCDVSVPWHLDGPAVWEGVGNEGKAALLRSEGVGRFLRGAYDVQYARALAAARRARGNDLTLAAKLQFVLGSYLTAEYFGEHYMRAHNLRRELTAAYDEALESVDLLAMPTTPMTAHEVREDLSERERLERSQDMGQNTAPFNLTGHPAISVPCGTVDGLPVGAMLVGGRFDDETLLAGAHTLERRLREE